MTYFEATRAEMVVRRSQLSRRIDLIEDDLQRYGETGLASTASEHPAGEVVEEFVATMARELGQVECAIRRIGSREYDCCMQCGGTIRHERLDRLPYSVNCEACSVHFPVEYLQQLRGRHSSLRRIIAGVLRAVSAHTSESNDAAARRLGHAPTMALLSELSRQLPERFSVEERDGYLTEALDVAPRFSRQATALMRQHAEFSQRIRAIVKEAEAALESADEWLGVRDHSHQLCLDLITHEQAECDIIESAFLDDMGASD
jgi:RNA polymerase-binding transcription factor DksA